MSRIVAALGGNALIRRGEAGSVAVQRRNLRTAATALCRLVAAGHMLVVTHGNGPQVGFLALEAEIASAVVPAPPLDVLGAESQGQIGYLLAQALHDALTRAGIRRQVAVVLTQTLVAADDPAFARPSKPVGPIYDAAEGARLAVERGWSVAPDGDHWRRVVPSPRPLGIVEADVIRDLVDAGVIVIASGGGGIPVVERPDGMLEGVEGVVDKDLAAVVLAAAVDADVLLLLTDVPAVHRDWGTATAEPIARLTTAQAGRMVRFGDLAPGSMRPKVEAAALFVVASGGRAAIGALEDAEALVRGSCGTQVTRSRARGTARPGSVVPLDPRLRAG